MTTVTLPADLGIESATDLKTLLTPLLDEVATVVLDGSAASRLHCASLQLVAAFLQHRLSHGLATRIDASEALDQAFGLIGLQPLVADARTVTNTPELNQEISE